MTVRRKPIGGGRGETWLGCLGKHRESQHGLLGKSFILYFQIILIVTLKFSDGGHVLLSHMWLVSSLVLSIAHVVVLHCIILYGIGGTGR